MSKPSSPWKQYLLVAWLLGSCALFPLRAQQRGNANQGRRTGTTGNATTPQYYPNGQVGEAMISSDPETRRLIVITDEDTSHYISQVVTNLDRPEPQVLIKVVFLEVTYNNSSDIGFEGGIQRQINGSTTGSASNLFGLAQQGIAATAPGMPTGAGLYQILGRDLQVTLRAIAQAGKVEVLSRPSILARNDQPAYINVGQTIPIITGSTVAGITGNIVNTISWQNIGISLQVTPFVQGNGMVQMMVTPTISALTDQTVNVSPGVNAPVISNRTADTVVVTPDGQTVVIGGLMQNNKTTTDNKIPVLGDIPLLGALFKHKITQNTKTELMIFLTPHVVMQPAQLAAVSARERNNAVLAHQAFSEQELDRFLDNIQAEQAKHSKKHSRRD